MEESSGCTNAFSSFLRVLYIYPLLGIFFNKMGHILKITP